MLERTATQTSNSIQNNFRLTEFFSHMWSHVLSVDSFGIKIHVPSMGNFILISQHILIHCYYRGADKSLARPGRKQVTATEDFGVHISYL